MPKVFISYVRENTSYVYQLARELKVYGIEVWIDKTDIKPGERWADAIRDGIEKGDFFIACFSEEYSTRMRTYMNEEITLAIEELRQRPTDRAWFIPVLLSRTEIQTEALEQVKRYVLFNGLSCMKTGVKEYEIFFQLLYPIRFGGHMSLRVRMILKWFCPYPV